MSLLSSDERLDDRGLMTNIECNVFITTSDSNCQVKMKTVENFELNSVLHMYTGLQLPRVIDRAIILTRSIISFSRPRSIV